MRADRVVINFQRRKYYSRAGAKAFERELRKMAVIQDDGERVARLAAAFCRWCWYFSRRHTMAGMAFTDTQCGLCPMVASYPSTNTDVLCLPCASRYDLCKHCGGDREMRDNLRTRLPKPSPTLDLTPSTPEPRSVEETALDRVAQK